VVEGSKTIIMAGLDPAVTINIAPKRMPGSSPGMMK
jgi:hypothetical protein